MHHMNKRIAAAVLWFFAGWYIGAYVAVFFAISGVIGPILGISAAALFAVDPRQVIWQRNGSVTAIKRAPESVRQDLAEAA